MVEARVSSQVAVEDATSTARDWIVPVQSAGTVVPHWLVCDLVAGLPEQAVQGPQRLALQGGVGHAPQSLGQVEQLSPAPHEPFPQVGGGVGVGQARQSEGQLLQVSPASQVPLTTQVPEGVGVGPGHAPQSCQQVAQFS